MRYEVRIPNNQPISVEATEFHNVNGGIVFFAERMRDVGTLDQWGNPSRRRQRVQTAYFNNVESVVEIPQEEFGVPIADPEPNIIGLPQTHVWFDEANGMAPRPIDADGINWVDAQRDE